MQYTLSSLLIYRYEDSLRCSTFIPIVWTQGPCVVKKPRCVCPSSPLLYLPSILLFDNNQVDTLFLSPDYYYRRADRRTVDRDCPTATLTQF